MPRSNNDWRIRISRSVDEDGRLLRYTVHFDRKLNGWYDEIRYDSFEVRSGKRLDAPHLHLKIHSSFKTVEAGVAEIREIIERHLPALREVAER
jgi:hypothetical protein